MQAAIVLPTIQGIDGAKTCKIEFSNMKTINFGFKLFESVITNVISILVVEKGLTDPYNYSNHTSFGITSR